MTIQKKEQFTNSHEAFFPETQVSATYLHVIQSLTTVTSATFVNYANCGNWENYVVLIQGWYEINIYGAFRG